MSSDWPIGVVTKPAAPSQRWADVRDCPKCGIKKGSSCRTPACPQNGLVGAEVPKQFQGWQLGRQ